MRANGTLALVATVSLGLFASASQAEKRISKSDLPAAVLKTAEEQSHGSTVRGYSVDRDHGRIEYEEQMLVDGHSKDVTIAPDGQVLEIEEQVKLTDLTAEVRSGLINKAGKGNIDKVESLTKHGTLVAYEAQVVTGSRRSEVQVGPYGKPLDHEE